MLPSISLDAPTMQRFRSRSRFLLLLCLLAALTMDSRKAPVAPPHPALARLPARMLWAWERAEDLRWLPPDVGVAYLASSIELRANQALVRRRTAPLLLSGATPAVPVLHVDASWSFPPTQSAHQRDTIRAELLRLAQLGNRNVVQLDFEVGRSLRPFLHGTVAAIRASLDPRIALSATALASWCLDDYWLQDSAADEIIPMAFRMGRDGGALRRRIVRQRGFTQARCRGAIGFASDEQVVEVGPRRRYYFSPTSWTAQSWQAVSETPAEPTRAREGGHRMDD
jgi:hypothetical protein